MQKAFRKFAERTSVAVGTHWAFMIAIGIIAAWGATGPLFGFSQQWQLVVNSFTTIVTFLMVFLIQNTQNRDFRILQLKLTELLRVSDDSLLLNVERFSDDELTRLERALESVGPAQSVSEILKKLHDAAEDSQRSTDRA
jgi:low affinity Fe/Cu permease